MIASQALSNMSGIPVPTEHTLVIVQIFRHLLPNHVDKQREVRSRHHRQLWYVFLDVHRGPMDLEGA